MAILLSRHLLGIQSMVRSKDMFHDSLHLTSFLRAGITCCNSLDDDTLTLYLSTHLSSVATLNLKKRKNSNGETRLVMDPIQNRSLKRRLQQLHQDHDREENLGGLSLMKSWGLASIPQDGLVTACISLHPGDMPEYVTPSLEKSVIVFASDISEDRTETFPWQEVPVVWDVTTTQKAIIEGVSDYNRLANGTSTELSVRISAAATAAEYFLAYTNDKQRENIDESCAICKDAIPFESLTKASCLQGHQCSELIGLVQTLPSLSDRAVGRAVCCLFAIISVTF